MSDQDRCLWKQCSSIREQTQPDYKVLYQQYCVPVRQRTFFRTSAASVVVVQEVALTLFLFLRFTVSIREYHDNDASTTTKTIPIPQELAVEASTMAMSVALLIAIVASWTSRPRKHRFTTAMTRSTDALLLAVLLRFLAKVLQSLTASYSSDTVTTLAMALLLLHVLLCDYTYANGGGRPSPTPRGIGHTERPAFAGGTLALNAVLSATTLLTSRTESVATSFGFLGLAVLLFGLYPQTRHAVAKAYPSHKSGKHE